MSLTDRVRFAFVCPLAWEKLRGDGITRHCDTCQRVVTNLSAMSAPDADRYLAAQTDAVCVRIEYDGAGRPMHVGTKLAAAAGLAIAAMAAPELDAATCATAPEQPAALPPRMMGKVALRAEDLAPVITITRLGIAVNDKPIVEFTAPGTYQLPPSSITLVEDRLRTIASDHARLEERGGPRFARSVLVVAEADAPYEVVKLAVDTAAPAGFREYKLIMRERPPRGVHQ